MSTDPTILAALKAERDRLQAIVDDARKTLADTENNLQAIKRAAAILAGGVSNDRPNGVGRPPISDDQIKQANRMLRDGVPPKQVAEAIGVHVQTIYAKQHGGYLFHPKRSPKASASA